MPETGLTPDFIVVDGAEGGTGAAPLDVLRQYRPPAHAASFAAQP